MSTGKKNGSVHILMPWRITSYDCVPSTMVIAHDLLPAMPQPLQGRWAVMAVSQQSGYGRRGQVWYSPPGNLYATFVHGINHPLNPGRWGVAVSLAIYDGCRALGVSAGDLALKWPNDVLLNGGKVAGILMETRSDYPHLILVGIGVNIQNIPEGLPYRGARLQDHLAPSRPISPRDLLVTILKSLDTIIQHIHSEAEWTALKNRWLSHAFGFGRQVTLIPRSTRHGTTNSPTLSGVFCDMDSDGAIVIHHDNGQKVSYRSGDVSLGFNTITSSG